MLLISTYPVPLLILLAMFKHINIAVKSKASCYKVIFGHGIKYFYDVTFLIVINSLML